MFIIITALTLPDVAPPPNRQAYSTNTMPLASFLQLAPEGTAQPKGASSKLTLAAIPITAAPSIGTKLATVNLTLFGFSDEKLMESNEIEGVRSYDVIPGSEKVLEASGRDLASVKAVLVINGTVKMDPPNFKAMLQSEEMSKSVGPMVRSSE